MVGDKRFVYVLRNADQTPQFYVGLTSDINARLPDHNTGRCPHTAVRFERYLKSGSGRAFAKRHFEP